MQVYNTLNLLTARPQADELAAVPHHLYGYKTPGSDYSTGHWVDDVKQILADIVERGKLPIFVGGTGLYFQALNGGLSPIPDIPHAIRGKWRNRLDCEGIEALYDELVRLDPELAQKLKPADRQRITRALEVVDATGQSIVHFQHEKGDVIIDPDRAKKIILLPERSLLHARIATRFQTMMDQGALEEVKALLAQNVDKNHTSMKAIGVQQITAFLNNELSFDAAIERAIVATRQYAKRQSTWFRNQLDDSWIRITQLANEDT